MLSRFRRLLGRGGRRYEQDPRTTVVITVECLHELHEALARATATEHEGIAYLAGLTADNTTLAVRAMEPEARTSRGSFDVSALAMTRVIRAAASCGLHVVGQVHTHPGNAYHSRGDEEGANIAYPGYTSIVLPDFGQRLPSFDGAALFVFQQNGGFAPVELERLRIVQRSIL